MAQRRMFSLQIVDTDAFMDMPLSAQALYFHLGMRADDDGFVSNARRIQKLVGAADDDLKILLMKRFVLAFDSGVLVITHWKISNYIQKDRYRPTLYQEEKAMLYLKADGSYTDRPEEGAKPCLPSPAKSSELPGEALSACPEQEIEPAMDLAPEPVPKPENVGASEHVSTMYTDCIRRLGKDRIGKVNNILSGGDGEIRAREAEKNVGQYLQRRAKNPAVHLGATPEILAAAECLTRAIFKKFASRVPTETDVGNAFAWLRKSEQDPESGQWVISFPQERQELLMYAFEQAAEAGKPADWHYIHGILRNLRLRNIRTIEDAEDYEYEHD